MPIYVYRCDECGQVEEHIQRFSDPPLTECEACGGALHKQVTSAAFHLKGAGWYRDGYASAKPDAASNGSSAGAGDGGGDGGGTSSETSAKADKPEKADKPAAKDKAGKKPRSAVKKAS